MRTLALVPHSEAKLGPLERLELLGDPDSIPGVSASGRPRRVDRNIRP